jgi:hypothetical protein
MPPTYDILIAGAGAAGLATAIFAARERPGVSIVLVDGARSLGAKILVSGGGRCNLTNAAVTAADFNGGTLPSIARTLGALPVPDTIAFFAALGVGLHEEPLGKMFPDSNRARTVLDALVNEARARGAEIRTAHRVTGVARSADGFRVESPAGDLTARRLVLATGGRSLPKSGSDGAGYEFARALGHTLVECTPALVPLVLAGDLHHRLTGVRVESELTLRTDSTARRRIRGSLLFTHVGVSGPAALDVSRHWLRARLEGRAVTLTASVAPGLGVEQADAALRRLAAMHPRASLARALARLPEGDALPAAVAGLAATAAGVLPGRQLAALTRAERRGVVGALTALPLPVTDSRGYNYAEVTAGGVTLREVDPASMASRVCPGLFLAGEILDVDGRLGGFNFQWAWASARAAARGLAASLG